MTFWLDDPDEVIHKFIGDKETARQVHLVAVFSGAQLFSKFSKLHLGEAWELDTGGLQGGSRGGAVRQIKTPQIRDQLKAFLSYHYRIYIIMVHELGCTSPTLPEALL